MITIAASRYHSPLKKYFTDSHQYLYPQKVTITDQKQHPHPQKATITDQKQHTSPLKKYSPDSNQYLTPQQKNTQHETSNNEKRPDTCGRCSASIWSFAGERERLTVSPLPADGYQDCRYRRHLRCRSHRRRLCRRRVSFRSRCRRRASSALPPRGGGCPAYRRPSPVFGA